MNIVVVLHVVGTCIILLFSIVYLTKVDDYRYKIKGLEERVDIRFKKIENDIKTVDDKVESLREDCNTGKYTKYL